LEPGTLPVPDGEVENGIFFLRHCLREGSGEVVEGYPHPFVHQLN
jgi:hypothetical protein